MKRVLIAAIVFACVCSVASNCDAQIGGMPVHEGFTVPHEYFVFGIVVAVHPKTSMITIRGSDLLGYLHFRVKTYGVRPTVTLSRFQAGDRIKAVYSVKEGRLYALRLSRADGRGSPRN